MPLAYKFVANNNIITKDVKQYPEGLTFLDKLESVLLRHKISAVLSECSTVEVYYISSAPSTVSTNEVLKVAQALSKQISDSKITSNRPHSMDFCARFVNSLIHDVSVQTVSHTPNLKRHIWEMSTYKPAIAVKKLHMESKTKTQQNRKELKNSWMSL